MQSLEEYYLHSLFRKPIMAISYVKSKSFHLIVTKIVYYCCIQSGYPIRRNEILICLSNLFRDETLSDVITRYNFCLQFLHITLRYILEGYHSNLYTDTGWTQIAKLYLWTFLGFHNVPYIRSEHWNKRANYFLRYRSSNSVWCPV